MVARDVLPDFPLLGMNRASVRSNGEKTIMTTATLAKWVRDPRSGQVHLPSEEVTIMGVVRNLDRTLLKVKWQAGGECVLFAEELEEIRQG
jgi:hypothetical protein